ncbi:MAG: DUF11 domain-containing protein, partial [Anaerolineae bacterium]|nr:DUF11 domain-containing protein [Anaerolineae bacterium]
GYVGVEYQEFWNDVPPVDIGTVGSVYPDDPTSQWQVTPPENEAEVRSVFRDRTAPPGGNPLLDIRADPTGGFRVGRGEDLTLIIWLRNNTEAISSTDCSLNAVDLYFRSITWTIYDRNGSLASGTITDPSEFWVAGQVSTPSDGRIPETYVTGGAANNAPSDIYTLIDFTVPETAEGHLNVVLNEVEFCLDAACTTVHESDYFTNYVDVISGPLATAEIKLVGGNAGRSAGEDAWFVIELTGLLGSTPLKDPVIRTVSDKGGTLPECRTTGNSPPPNGSWYKMPFVPDFATGIDVADPATFNPSVGNTAYNYNSAAPLGPGNDIFDMNLLQTQTAYCAFRKTLLPDASGNFVLEADLEVTGYPPYPAATKEYTYTVHVQIVVPVGAAAIRVDKTIIGPLVQPPEIDPNTGLPRVKTIVNVGETITYEITVTNTGDVDLNNVSLIDSLIGPYTFPANDVIHPEDSPGVCTNAPCSMTITLSYVVKFTDPNPIQNIVEGRARIVGTTFQVAAQDVASILKAESELQLVLTTDPA